jgi:predicted site-specific integrase-resolvase
VRWTVRSGRTVAWRPGVRQNEGFSNQRAIGDARLIFRPVSCILKFEKLVALFRRKSNEIPELLERVMQVGYARVSTRDQHLTLQRDALRKAGCQQIYEEVVSGARAERPVLQQTLAQLREGDVLLIWKLDRLGRSLRHLIEVVTDLAERGIGFKSLQEHRDTTTSSGKLMFHMFRALAEFERDLIRERTQAGLAAARARGRPSKISSPEAFPSGHP